MTPEIAAALVGAGMISLLVYPQVAMGLRSQTAPPLAQSQGNVHPDQES
jgi:hypothetical protein